MKIGFLLNHYELHQIPHLAPYAFELSLRHHNIDVAVLASSDAELDFARTIGVGYPGHRVRFHKLAVPRLVHTLDKLLSKAIFIRKYFTLACNGALLSSFDALVTPEVTSLELREKPLFHKTKLIFTGHGAGDTIFAGMGGIIGKLDQFDLYLLPGRKYATDLIEHGGLPQNKYAIAGYPKLEAVDKLGIRKQNLFDNNRPTVLYNPHQSKRFTSWHTMGEAVLDYFYRSEKYNLIFTPHVLLFKRHLTKGAKLPARFRNSDTVLIDKGSMRSIDMTYLKSADIYLGDGSSQIYEFIETPRPCVFLNGHNVAWQGDKSYFNWTFGPVIERADDLEDALDAAIATFPTYRPKQEEAFSARFLRPSEGEISTGQRGADIIAEFMKTGAVSKRWLA